jgi:uncharacterized membrane protein
MILEACLGKVNIRIDNNYPCKVWGSWDRDPAERTVEHRRPLEPDPDNSGGGKNMNKKTSHGAPRSRVVALTSIMAALVAVTTMIAIPMPPPLSTITFAPIIIFVSSILLGPSAGLVCSAVGSALGFVGGSSIGTIMVPAGYLYVFLLGIVVARGPMGFSVGLLRKKSEMIAMIVGVIVETLIFFTIDTYLFGVAIAVLDFGTLVDLVFVPVTYAILVTVRRILDITYLA